MTSKDELKAFYIEEKDVDAYSTLLDNIRDSSNGSSESPEDLIAVWYVYLYVIGVHDVGAAINYFAVVNVAVYKYVKLWG